MASSLLDLARPTQVNPSLSQPSALNSPATAKPKARFNDVLAQHRPAEPKEPRADRAEPSAKTDRPKKTDAAKSKKEARPADDARPTDEADTDTTPTDEAEAAEAQASQATDKPKKTKPTKDTEKVDENAEAGADEAEAVEDQTPTSPIAELPTAETPAEVDEVIDGEKKPVAEEKPADEDAVDPNLLAAQLNPAQQPIEEQPADIDGQTDADAAADVTGVSPAIAKAQTEAAKAQPAAKPAEAVEAEKEVGLKPHAEKAHLKAAEDVLADADEAAGAFALPAELTKTDGKTGTEVKLDPSAALQAVGAAHDKPAASHANALPAVPQAEAPVAPRTVAEENVDRIVTSIHGDIATKGGTMQIRLDPPSLGAINVQISIDDGVMSASLQTNNDEATRLLSHNLAQLKSQLESAGVTVDRIQVKQATPTEQSSNSNSQSDGGDRQQNRDAGQDQSARQEQQRREMLQRMWAKLAGNGDPLDLVA